MLRRQAFKYELRPKGAQVRQLRQFAGSCRYVFNRALALQQERHAQGEKHLSYATLCRRLTMWRHADDTAWLSDGTCYAPFNSFRKHETALRKAQQQLSHKVKFSNNWTKAKRRVQRLHTRIARVRHDYLHKTSTTISKNHAFVCIEDLQVVNMSASARGTKEQPGTQVKAKSGLNKAILDQGWREFRRHLDYKLAWKGGHLIAVPPQNTSRTCPSCGHIAKANRQTQAHFKCVSCGYEANADVAGAINVLRAGHARFACEVNGVGHQQQEPTEATQAMALYHA